MIERLLAKLNSIPADKIAHALGGVLISVVSVLIYPVPLVALLIVALIALGKEAYDWLHKDQHTPDPYDALATIIGGAIPLLPVLLTTHWK